MLKRLALLVALAGCASAGDPPGGPPDVAPPVVVQWVPDSGMILETPPRELEILFDEVISEQVAAQRREIANAIVLSPDTTVPRVSWHRDRLTVRPRDGFKPGRVYRVELLPMIQDLRQNRMRRGRTIVFSTGPAIPTAQLEGTLVDWPAARAAVSGLIEAVLLPDSLPYRAITDSAGNFRLAQVPPGEYVVYGTIDQSADRRRGARELFDTVRVTLGDSSLVELYAFLHDTTGPRLRTVEVSDSVTIRLTFDRPLDPTARLDTQHVHLALVSDSTTLLGVSQVLTLRQADSARTAEAAARAAARQAQDSTRQAQDTTRRGQRPVTPRDTTARRPAADTARAARGARGQETRRDSTRAQRMLARRPPPTDARVVRLLAPLIPDERYIVWVDSARSLSGVVPPLPIRGQLRAPRPARPDSTRRDTMQADTVRADTTLPASPRPR